jgi:WD40 repeat protein
VSFSADGKAFLAADNGNGWQLFTSEGRFIASGQHDPDAAASITSIAWSPTGLLVATADGFGKVILRDARTGQPSGQPLQQDRQSIPKMSFSPDGRWLATASQDKSLRVWDTVTRQLLFRRQMSESVEDVSFSPSGRYLLTTSLSGEQEGEARIWDVGTGLMVGPKLASVRQATWSPDGRTIVTAGSDRMIKVWAPFAAGPQLSLEQQERLRRGIFTADGTTVAVQVGDHGQALRAADFDRPDFGLEPKQSDGDRWRLALSDDGSILVEVRSQETLVYDLKGKRSLPTFKHDEDPIDMSDISAVEIGHDGFTVLLAGGNASDKTASGHILVWNALTGKAVCPPLEHGRLYVNAASFSSDGNLIVSAGRDGTARLWALPSCELRHSLEHGAPVANAAFDRTGRYVATAGSDGGARIWDATTGKLVGPIMPHEVAVQFVAFSPDGSSVLTIADSPEGKRPVMRLWDAATHRPKAAPTPLVGDTRSLAWGAGFSPDGQFVVVSEGLQGFRVRSAANLEPITPYVFDESADGRSWPAPAIPFAVARQQGCPDAHRHRQQAALAQGGPMVAAVR